MDSYRQAIEALGLSIERYTEAAPKDGWFYVILKGEVRGRHRSLNRALVQYHELRDACGWTPPPVERRIPDPGVEAVERYMDELTDYWGSSHSYRKPGVKRA